MQNADHVDSAGYREARGPCIRVRTPTALRFDAEFELSTGRILEDVFTLSLEDGLEIPIDR